MSTLEIHIDESFEALTHNPEALLKALSPWFMTRRWSGLGGLSIERIEVSDCVKIVSSEISTIFSTLVQIVPAESKPRIFYVPIHLKLGRAENGWIPVRCMDRTFQVREAEYSKEYNDFLLHDVAKSSTIDSLRGTLAFRSLETVPRELETQEVTILGKGDTTNIVVVVEIRNKQALAVKTYKNLTENNPELEMLTVLTKARFKNAPKIVGEMKYIGLGKILVLTILQEYVTSLGDGRPPFAEALRRELKGNRSFEHTPFGPFRLAWRLGEIIASMHHAFGCSQVEGFGASRITNEDIEEWKDRVEELLEDFLKDSFQMEAAIGSPVSELLAVVASKRSRILEYLAPMAKMLGMKRVRTHQDLHLAQLLTTQDVTDFLIIDFEGDPQRIGEDRKKKECPLRDLGTMARSFSYLRYSVLKELMGEKGYSDGLRTIASSDLPSQLLAGTPMISSLDNWIHTSKEWEGKVLKAMIEGYLSEEDKLGDKFLSDSSKVDFEVVNSIVKVWEIEKALLEARYEIHHRPENLVIPLAGLLTLCL